MAASADTWERLRPILSVTDEGASGSCEQVLATRSVTSGGAGAAIHHLYGLPTCERLRSAAVREHGLRTGCPGRTTARASRMRDRDGDELMADADSRSFRRRRGGLERGYRLRVIAEKHGCRSYRERRKDEPYTSFHRALHQSEDRANRGGAVRFNRLGLISV